MKQARRKTLRRSVNTPVQLLCWCLMISNSLWCQGEDNQFMGLELTAAIDAASRSEKVLMFVISSNSEKGDVAAMILNANRYLPDWFGAEGILIKVDAIQDPIGAFQLDITDLPAIAIYSDGALYKLIQNFSISLRLKVWLEGAKYKKKELAAYRLFENSSDVSLRMLLAEELTKAGMLDEALGHYRWLWTFTSTKPQWTGLRVSGLREMIRRLCVVHPPAKAVFTEFGLSTYKSIFSDAEAMREWWHISVILQEEDKIIDEYLLARDDSARRQAFEVIADDLYELFVAEKRYALAGEIVDDPVAMANEEVANIALFDDLLGSGSEYHEALLLMRVRLGNLYSSCLAANRDSDAGKIAKIFIDRDNERIGKICLVRAAIRANRGTLDHLRWLQEAGVPDTATVYRHVQLM